jgi:hypothetical protein
LGRVPDRMQRFLEVFWKVGENKGLVVNNDAFIEIKANEIYQIYQSNGKQKNYKNSTLMSNLKRGSLLKPIVISSISTTVFPTPLFHSKL